MPIDSVCAYLETNFGKVQQAEEDMVLEFLPVGTELSNFLH